MLEYGGTQASTSGRPSEVPFIGVLEFVNGSIAAVYGPSGVPFIEMLELLGDGEEPVASPSGVPFIEMLESKR